MQSGYFYKLITVFLLAAYCWVGLSWYMEYRSTHNENGFTVCIIKNLTDAPCPSCGSTRSMLSLFSGDWNRALLINPLGILLAAALIFLPLWLIFDIRTGRETLFDSYKKSEALLKKRKVLLVFAVLIIANWIWNINKGL